MEEKLPGCRPTRVGVFFLQVETAVNLPNARFNVLLMNCFDIIDLILKRRLQPLRENCATILAAFFRFLQ